MCTRSEFLGIGTTHPGTSTWLTAKKLVEGDNLLRRVKPFKAGAKTNDVAIEATVYEGDMVVLGIKSREMGTWTNDYEQFGEGRVSGRGDGEASANAVRGRVKTNLVFKSGRGFGGRSLRRPSG